VAVSRIGMGGYELGPEPGDSPDVGRAVSLINAALESGVNWLDTSENYLETQNESLIGAALRRTGDGLLIASKVAPGAGITGGGSGFRRAEVHGACRESLRRLGRDHIDIYFMHWPDDTGVPLEETWGAMAELVDEGFVRAIGMSNYELEEVELCHEQRAVDAVQVGLSLIDYLDARGAIARYGELGIAVTVFDVLGSGILTGKTLEDVLALWTGPWTESGFYQRLLAPSKAERSFAVADGLRPIAARLGATVSQVALAWVLHQPGVSAALAGSRSPAHIRENARAAAVDLPRVLAEIEDLIPLGPAFTGLADQDRHFQS
jgi:aryl-alcohol dehydrogenase-like predicted oxidoreductase